MSESGVDHEFVSKARHGLKNPLAIIREGIAIVQDGTLGPVNDEQKTFLETAKRNVDRLLCMINDVFEYEELRLAIDEGEEEACSCAEIMKEVCASFSETAEKNGVSLECVCADELPAVMGDRALIASVVKNLLVNALQATVGKGTIRVTTVYDDDDVVIVVEDSGSGVADDFKHMMFEPFSHNFKNQTTVSAGNLGMGLAIVEEIVMRYEGSYAVTQSDLGGCCVRVSFPVEDEE